MPRRVRCRIRRRLRVRTWKRHPLAARMPRSARVRATRGRGRLDMSAATHPDLLMAGAACPARIACPDPVATVIAPPRPGHTKHPDDNHAGLRLPQGPPHEVLVGGGEAGRRSHIRCAPKVDGAPDAPDQALGIGRTGCRPRQLASSLMRNTRYPVVNSREFQQFPAGIRLQSRRGSSYI